MTTSKLVFDPFSEEFFNGAWDTYRRMQEEAPVYYSEEYDFYALTRHEDVAAGLKDFETYSSAYGIDLSGLASQRLIDPVAYLLRVLLRHPQHCRHHLDGERTGKILHRIESIGICRAEVFVDLLDDHLPL